MNLLKNKKVLMGVSCVFVIAIIFSITLYKNDNNKVYQAKTEEKEENQVGGFLTLMLETEAGSGQYQESTTSTWPGDGYVFNSELSSCQNGSKLSWNEELGAVTLSTSIADSCYVYFDLIPPTFADNCRETESNTLACYVAAQYTADGENGLYYHNTDLENGAGDNSYRYAGANPNNYVCFGSDSSPCPDSNLYRIIGVFGNQVKLIMADYPKTSQIGTSGTYSNTYYDVKGDDTSYYKGDQSVFSIGVYSWSLSETNTWSSSSLTTINLNSTFLNTFSSIYQEDIASVTWYVGGYSSEDAIPKTFYNAESSGTTWTGKIGLMYVSDYGFAASPEYWTTFLEDYDTAISNNWMFMGLDEWTISRNSGSTYSAYSVLGSGLLFSTIVGVTAAAVRPVFYLNSDVEYSSGSGTESDPVRIIVDSSGPSVPTTPSKPDQPTGPSIGDGDWEGGLQ